MAKKPLTDHPTDAEVYWSGFDRDDVVLIPGRPCRVGELLVDRELEIRALAWSSLVVESRETMRDAYGTYQCTTVVPGMTDAERIDIFAKAGVRIGLMVVDKVLEVEERRRQLASLARSAVKQAEQEERWGTWVRKLLHEDSKRTAPRLAVLLRANEAVKDPPTLTEQSTFKRFVRRVKDGK